MRLRLLALALLAAYALHAQEHLFTPTAPAVQINRAAFTVHPGNNLQTLKATVNGQPCTLLLDTGASHTTFDTAFLKRALPDIPTERVALGGETNVETAPLAFPIRTLTIGEATLTRFVGMALPLGHLSEAAGTPIDGILGMNVLGYAPFRLSVAEGAITWFSAPPLSHKTIPAPVLDTVDNGIHLVGTRGDEPTTFPVLIDSGSSLTFMDSKVWPAAEGSVSMGATGVNATEASTFQKGRPDTLHLGSLTLPLEPLLRPGEIPQIGADTLKRFDLIFDARTRKAWLAFPED